LLCLPGSVSVPSLCDGGFNPSVNDGHGEHSPRPNGHPGGPVRTDLHPAGNHGVPGILRRNYECGLKQIIERINAESERVKTVFFDKAHAPFDYNSQQPGQWLTSP
jgi:hypothetical protein